MIKGKELLTGCKTPIMQVVFGLESKYGEITILSGYRSEKQNKDAGGAKSSQHMLGLAIDVFVANVSPIKIAAFVLEKYPAVNGIGLDVYNGYCHIDCREGEKTYWVYDKQGKTV